MNGKSKECAFNKSNECVKQMVFERMTLSRELMSSEPESRQTPLHEMIESKSKGIAARKEML